MKSARNQLILLGFICQSLAWEGYYLLLINVLLWVGCLTLPRKPIRFRPATESAFLWAGCAAAFLLSPRLGQSTHFFIGHGLTVMQAVRLLRPLNRREKIFSVLMACFQLAVGCTFIFDYRFILILAAAIILVPKSLMELEAEPFPSAGTAKPVRLSFGACAVVVAVMVVFFLVFPRGLIGSPLQYNPPRLGDEGSLLESVLDPASGGSAQSERTLLQIDGEQLGYLRCLALRDFDGKLWHADEAVGLHPFPPVPAEQLDQFKIRRVRVKSVAFLGRILPTDGRVVYLNGKFFRRPFLNAYGIVECESMWNTANNAYEYRIETKPKPERLAPALTAKYTNYPPQSARLQAWLDDVLAGATTPIEQARRLESYLRNHFQYKLGAPELNRARPVDDFIFNRKQGHCERFAASLALLLRMKGIPSRIVIGYLPVSRNRFTGWYNIRFKDAHAWTEAYIQGRGWLQLDATPGAPEELTGWNFDDLLETLDVIWYSNIVNFDGATQKYLLNVSVQSLTQFPEWARQHFRFLTEFALGVLLVILWQIYRVRRRTAAPPAPVRNRTQVLAEHYYGQMLQAVDRWDCHRRSHQTPFEFLSELEQRSLPVLTEARLITNIFCATRYGRNAIAHAQQSEIEQALRRIKMARQTAAHS
ncbi:MAG: DUF4129 domain-containing transglutaminase family protein [Limisphaerales bacterium]